jgi:hypothetical protein
VQISALLACKECLCQLCFDLLMRKTEKLNCKDGGSMLVLTLFRIRLDGVESKKLIGARNIFFIMPKKSCSALFSLN